MDITREGKGQDTVERQNARQGLTSTYRRPSWEWVACVENGRTVAALSDEEHAEMVAARKLALGRLSKGQEGAMS